MEMEKININLPNDYLIKLDEFIKEEKTNRSQFIREATEHYMQDIKEQRALEKRRAEITEAIKIQDEFREKYGKVDWDPVEEIRKMRDSR